MGSESRRPRHVANSTDRIVLPTRRMQLTPGTIVSERFEITEMLGQGGMGVVLAADDLETRKEVALKVLQARAVTCENLQRFKRETRTARALRHPHICSVYGYGTLPDGSPYIVMERLRGETLQTRLRMEGMLSIGDAVTATLQLLDGLTAAHARGVLHRDVKPANVFLTSAPGEPPFVRLIDFGLAKLLPAWLEGDWSDSSSSGSDDGVITKTGVTPGTPQYLAPEQIEGARDLDVRADVWAAGVVFYEMLTARKAFQAFNYQALATAICTADPAAIGTVRSDVPAALEAVIAKAMAKSRRNRYQTAQDFRTSLMNCWVRVRAEGISRGRLFSEGKLKRAAPVAPPPEEADMLDDKTIEVPPLFADSTPSSNVPGRKRSR